MKRRPIQIIILAVAQLLSPVVSVFLNAVYFHVTPRVILYSAWHAESWIGKASFFLGGPVLAVAIYAVKRWSYPVCLACIALTGYINASIWWQHPQQVTLGALAAIYLSNLLIIGYLLLPQVRIAYLERKMRWWENHPRYLKKTTLSLNYEGATSSATMLDISVGGMLLVTDRPLLSGKTFEVNLDQLKNGQPLVGRIVYSRRTANSTAYGVQFDHTPTSKKQINDYIADLKRQGIPSSIEPRNLFQETKELAVRFFTKGQGFLPELSPRSPRHPDAEPKSEKTSHAA